MNKEIKEILEDLKDEDKYIEEYGYQYKRVSVEDTKVLLDYITNLEQENERLKNGVKELDNMFYETFRISQNHYYSISEWKLKEFTDKLKELKEGK